MHDALYPLLLVLLTSTLLLGSCGLTGSDDSREPQIDNTYFRATLNGEEAWSGRPDAALSKQGRFNWFVISADSIYESRLYIESLSFGMPFHGTGEYSLVKAEHEINEAGVRVSGASFYESEVDVLIASYHATDDTSTNQLTITSYDSTTGIMTGTFRTTVVVDEEDRVSEPGEPPRRQPDTLRFTDGTFRVKVRDLRE